jgi:hypothetical protein
MWVQLAFQAATAIAKNYQERKSQEDADAALANKIIDAIKQEINSVKVEILHKLDDLQKEELQGLLRGYLNNFELYKIDMPNEVDWTQRLLADANYLCGKMYVVFRRYLNSKDYNNSRDLLAMYTPVVTTYIYLLNEIRINFGNDNTPSIVNTIKGDVLPGVADFLELLNSFTISRFSSVKETIQAEPHPDEKLSTIILSYDVLDGVGGAIEIGIMTFTKNKQQYRTEINKMRQDAIDKEIQKLKEQIGVDNYVDEVTKIADNIYLQITQ